MVSTRSVAPFALAALLVTSGCIGFVSGDEALTYEANEVGVSEDARQATGYERQFREQMTVNQTVSDREVRVTNWIARYEKYDDLADEKTGALAVVSTHRVDVFGHTTNPFAKMTNRELLENVTSNYDTSLGTLDDLRFVENKTRTVLGKETQVSVFETVTEFGGEELEVKLYVTRVRHGDDYVIAIGGHPTKLPEGEQEILLLMEAIEHEVDEENKDDKNERLVGTDSERLRAVTDDGRAVDATPAVRVAR